MTALRILLAEDEKALSKAIVKIFEKNHYSVDAVFNGEDALLYIETGNYDVVVLDVMMPKMDGFTVLRRVRSAGNQIPMLILSARGEVEDRVQGLDCGANDYLPKPFDTRELLARIRSVTRTRAEADSSIAVGNVTLNRATYELSSPKACIRLANKEYQIMELFMTNPHHVIPTERFMEKIWGHDSDSEINVVWVNISNLRKKLTSLEANIQIKVLRNAGYSLEDSYDS